MRLKRHAAESDRTAFTKIELLVVVVVLVVLAGIVTPPYSPPGKRSALTVCMANQKQVAIASIIYACDHEGRFPWSTRPTEADLFPSTIIEAFEPLRPFLGDPTKVLVCPTDTRRFPTTNALQSTNLSYFINLSSRMNGTNQVLTGDRHLAANGTAVGAGRFVLPPTTKLGWTDEIHRVRGKPRRGVIGSVDGSAQIVAEGGKLREAFDRGGQADLSLLVP